MKRYLNRAEKQEVLVLGGIAQTLEEQAVKNRKLGRNSRAKWLKTASTYTSKVLREIMQPLSDEQAKIVIAEAERSKIYAVKQSEVDKIERCRVRQDVPVDYIYGLAKAVIEGPCINCQLAGKDAQECEARAIMLKIDVPVYDENPPDGVCPYRVESRK